MSTNFRSEIFKLCQKLQTDRNSQEVGKAIHDMSVVTPKQVGQKATDSNNDLAYLAKHSNTQFHGFIFIDDNLEALEIPDFFHPKHLVHKERSLMEQGHKTLVRFIELCLSDIASESMEAANAINPYFLYKEVKISENTNALLTDAELQDAVTAFKSGAVYKALMKAKFTNIFKTTNINGLYSSIVALEKEIDHSLGENVSSYLRDFSLRTCSKWNGLADVMLAVSILIVALKVSLKISCNLMYRAICGIDLFVLNNDNIINIEKRTSTSLSEFYKVFAQDIQPDFSGSEMGSILLIDCDLPYDTHIHEFGMLIAQTINLWGEFGESAKYSFVTVDKELIHIHQLVRTVLDVGLPTITCNERSSV